VWFKVDDSFAFHPKTMAAGNPAIGLWVRAGAWAGDQHTGGHIPYRLLGSLGTRAQARDLVKSRLWIPDSDSWRFHDWTDYQPSAHDLELMSQARTTASHRANHIRWHTRRGITDPECPHCQDDQT
jgi:hypothetical protein